MLEYVHVQNFRCYESIDLDLKPGINLLIGDNASGKTSLLKACRYLLGAWFAGYSDENTKMDSPQNRDFRIVFNNGILSASPNIRIHFKYREGYLVPMKLKEKELKYDAIDFWVGKNSKKNSRMLLSGIRELKSFCKALYVEPNEILPLFASYTTKDIHSNVKIEASKFKEYQHYPSFGYYRCLTADGLFPYWKNRLLVLKELDMPNCELDIVKEAIIRVLGKDGCKIIKDIHIRPIKREVYYTIMDGRMVPQSLLSDGYKRLVSIVMDLAFRCAILNGFRNLDSVLDKTPGIVLIDEIDEHLHPSLQTVVLPALSKAFPRVQFIVSTHAPMVMTGVESNERNVVYKLSYSSELGYQHEAIDTYGLDASTIISRYLQLSPRSAEVQKELDELDRFLDKEDVQEAKIVLTRLKDKFSDTLPELARAESILTYLSDDLD